MQTKITSLKNPQWGDSENTFINCEITLEAYGDEVLPFTATDSDPEEHGRALFAALVVGQYGEIAPYSPPSPEPEVNVSVGTVPTQIL